MPRKMDDMRFRGPILVALAIAFVGCEQSTGPALDAIDDASLAQFAEHVSEASDVRLPSLGALLRASRYAIQAMDEGNTAAVRHFHAARGFAMAAEDSLEAGNKDAAKRLSNRSYGHTLQGILAALGPEVAATAVAGSAAGLARIQVHIEGREVSERIAARVARIAERVAKAEAKLAAGEAVVALHHALDAAEALRHLSPRYVAGKWIQHATRSLRAGIQAVGDGPTEEEAQALRRARRLLNVAKNELEAGHPRRSVEAAARSVRLSAGVIRSRSTGGQGRLLGHPLLPGRLGEPHGQVTPSAHQGHAQDHRLFAGDL